MRTLAYTWEGIQIAFDALRSYKMRSLLTTLGIVIGVMTVITIVSLVQGLNQAFANQISAIGTDILYVDKLPWIITSREQFFKMRNRPNITVDDAEKIKEYATLAKGVSPAYFTQRTVKYKNKKSERVAVIGTTDEFLITDNSLPEQGRFLMPTDIQHRRNVCVLGWEVANVLFEKADPLGKRIIVGEKKFRVIGVVEKKGSMFDFNMDNQIFIPIGVFQTLFGARYRSVQISVKAISPAEIEDAEMELEGLMRRFRGIPPGKENNFAINKQSMLMETYKNLTNVLWAVAIGVGAISLLVGGIGIMNILLVSVTERTREIGIRKALGARKVDIMVQFLIEAMMICAVGVFIGILFAIGLAKLIASTTPIPAAITAWVAILGLSFVVTIGLFFGIYPASKAAKLNPIDALRYE
jgi:putative ABC transport system permease protein